MKEQFVERLRKVAIAIRVIKATASISNSEMTPEQELAHYRGVADQAECILDDIKKADDKRD